MPGVVINPGVLIEEIRKVESTHGFELPEEVKEFFLAANGIVVRQDLELLSLEAALHYFHAYKNDNLFGHGLLALVDNNDSDPLCVWCTGPLRGYVVHICHDDDSRVKWRSFRSFLEQFVPAVLSDEPFEIHDLSQELEGPERTQKDVAAGRKTLEYAATFDLHSAESELVHDLAFDLLGKDEVSEIARFFEHPDWFVIRSARERLAEIKTAEAEKCIAKYWRDVHALLQRVSDVLQRNGFTSTFHADYDLRTEPGAIAWNYEGIYSERNRSDFDDWILERARSLRAMKEKQK